MKCTELRPFGRAWGVVGILVMGSACGSALADTIKVPGDKATIQAAIDAAKAGDIVLVADGTYTGPGNRNLDFKGKLIAVKSEHGASKTTIDCQGADRAAVFDDGEVQDTSLEGFTITGGSAPAGGALLIVDSNPTIRDCVLKGNVATGTGSADGGGAVSASDHANPRFLGCTFDGNSGKFGGAVVFNTQCEPTIDGCTFKGNTAGAGGSGGAVAYFDRSRGTVSASTFTGNKGPAGGAVHTAELAGPAFQTSKFDSNEATAGGGGALMLVSGSVPTFTGCTLTKNKASGDGGAAGAVEAGSVGFNNTVFSGNTAAGSGGAMAGSGGGSPALFGCALVGNTAQGGGGGVYGSSVSLQVKDTTMTLNTAAGAAGGGGVLMEGGGDMTVANSVLYADAGSPGGEFRLTGGSVLFISYSDVKGGQAGVVLEGGSALGWLGGNLDADPKFLSTSNVRLAPDSPCIDSADNSSVPGTITEDPDGTPRFVDDPKTTDTGQGRAPIVDMGSYEYRCPADCNTDAKLNINDFICFQAKWRAREPYGDFDGSGTYTINDFIRFQSSFVHGCP